MTVELPDGVAPIWTINTQNRRHWISIVGPVQAKMEAGDRELYRLEDLKILSVVRDRETLATVDWEWVQYDPDGLWEFANDHDLHLSKEGQKAVKLAIQFIQKDLVIRDPIMPMDLIELYWKYVIPNRANSGVYLGGIGLYAFNPDKANEKGLWEGWEPYGQWELAQTKAGDVYHDPRMYWVFNYINLMRNHLRKTSTDPAQQFSESTAFIERFIPILPSTRFAEEEEGDSDATAAPN